MVSVDPPETNKAFAEQEHADFVMLSDPTRKVADAYGVLNAPSAAQPDAPRMACASGVVRNLRNACACARCFEFSRTAAGFSIRIVCFGIT